MLRCRDSNPDLLSNNQVFFRLNDIGSSHVVLRVKDSNLDLRVQSPASSPIERTRIAHRFGCAVVPPEGVEPSLTRF
jgi:hypothetical protein